MVRHSNNARGFSLVELMVVVGIIGILSAVALPKYAAFRARARDSVRVTDMHNYELALRSYFVDNGAFPPNPLAGNTACKVASDAGCLQEISSFFPNNKLPVDPGRADPSALGATAWTVGSGWSMYAYIPYQPDYAVVHANLEATPNTNPCSFAQGQWCDSTTEKNPFCLCLSP